MPHSPPAAKSAAPPMPEYSLLAGVLSYLVPGLGQVYQGRVGKGLLFMVCLYALFFYGMGLGQWSNVYLPRSAKENNKENNPYNLPETLANLYNRPQYAGQFWIGIAAWPALWQYHNMPLPSADASPWWHQFQRTPPEQPEDKEREHWQGPTRNELQIKSDKRWDLAWVYTVIAGVLNVLVIYDAVAGPAFGLMAAAPNAREAPKT